MAKDGDIAQTIHGTYYPHIDGIRALAVLPVVLYHIRANICPGGFAGVDVFFVISGYLICGGILRDLHEERFSILQFYYRRIRRILPAYILMIAVVFMLGCIIYYSWPLRDLAETSVMGSFFSANLYFWLISSDYFAPDNNCNPLMHLWSLSVEEQFYMFIPLFLCFMWKFCRRFIKPTVTIIAALSLASAIYTISRNQQNNAFYLLHLRGWELLSGALLAMNSTTVRDTQKTKGINNPKLPSLIGLVLVLLPYSLLSPNIPFPGATAIPSIFGTVLLIQCGQTRWLNQLLSWRPFVGIGKISYSLYLWHWPVIVFWKYIVYNQMFMWDYIGMFVLSIVLAYLSWRFVEIPIRTSSAWTMRRTFTYATAGIVLLVFVGMACALSNGWPRLLHRKANEVTIFSGIQQPGRLEFFIFNSKHLQWLKSWGFSDRIKRTSTWAFVGGHFGTFSMGKGQDAEVLLLGDSHSAVLRYGLSTLLAKQGHSGVAISEGSLDIFNLSSDECKYIVERLSNELCGIKKVVISINWTGRIQPSEFDEQFIILKKFVYFMKKMNKNVYILTDVPIQPFSPVDINARQAIISPRKLSANWDEQQTKEQYLREQGKYNVELKSVCDQSGAILIPVHQAFVDNDHCIAYERVDHIKRSLYIDTNHLSTYGSLRAAHFMMPYLYPSTCVTSHNSTRSISDCGNHLE